MNNATNISYLSLALALSAIPLNLSLTKSPAAIAQSTPLDQTLILCETEGTAVRIYEEDENAVMRAFDREQNVVFMNSTPVESGELPTSTSYRNLLGEPNVTTLANKLADECSISINGQSETGRLLVDNRTAETTPPETPAADAAVTGTLTYSAQTSLPPGSIITTQLVDLTGGATISEQTITTTSEQVPLPFSLAYDPSEIVPEHRYVVEANIFVEDELRWTTEAVYPVITQQAPLTADIELVRVDAAEPPEAEPPETEPPETEPPETEPPEAEPMPDESSELPTNVEQAVKVTFISEIGETKLEVGKYSRETWSDGCLGLGRADEACLAALTEGWQVELIDRTTDKGYVYRTNADGSAVRRDTSK